MYLREISVLGHIDVLTWDISPRTHWCTYVRYQTTLMKWHPGKKLVSTKSFTIKSYYWY